MGAGAAEHAGGVNGARGGLGSLTGLFTVGTGLFVKALNGLRRDELLTRPGPRSNPLLWIAGHLAQSRCRLLRLLGVPREVPWESLFATGSKIGEPSQYPAIEEIQAVWRDVTEQLMYRLEAIGDDELSRQPPTGIATSDGTLRGAIALFAFHEAYHVGQMGYVRKWLGHSALIEG